MSDSTSPPKNIPIRESNKCCDDLIGFDRHEHKIFFLSIIAIKLKFHCLGRGDSFAYTSEILSHEIESVSHKYFRDIIDNFRPQCFYHLSNLLASRSSSSRQFNVVFFVCFSLKSSSDIIILIYSFFYERIFIQIQRLRRRVIKPNNMKRHRKIIIHMQSTSGRQILI